LLEKLNLKSSYGEFYKSYNEDKLRTEENVFEKLHLDKTLNNYENTITHWTTTLKATVDYIWHNEDGDYSCTGILQAPDLDIMSKYENYPNEIFGSDHFSIVSEFTKKF